MSKQSKAEKLPETAAIAQARYVRMTPRKVRRVVDVVRGMKTGEALSVLEFSPWRACTPVGKTIRSAVANAEHNKQLDPDLLWISEAYVDEGPSLRRWRPRAQGRAYPVHKRTSHITVVVEAREEDGRTVAVPPERGTSRRRGRAERPAAAPEPAEDTAAEETEQPAQDEASESAEETRAEASADQAAGEAEQVDEAEHVDEAAQVGEAEQASERSAGELDEDASDTTEGETR